MPNAEMMVKQLDGFLEVLVTRLTEKNKIRAAESDEGSGTSHSFANYDNFHSASQSSAEFGFSDDEKEGGSEKPVSQQAGKVDDEKKKKTAEVELNSSIPDENAASAADEARTGGNLVTAAAALVKLQDDGIISAPTEVTLVASAAAAAAAAAALAVEAESEASAVTGEVVEESTEKHGASTQMTTEASSLARVDNVETLPEAVEDMVTSGVVANGKEVKKKATVGLGLRQLEMAKAEQQAVKAAKMAAIQKTYANFGADIAREVRDKSIHSRALEQVQAMVKRLKIVLDELKRAIPPYIESVNLSNYSSCSTRVSGGLLVLSFNLELFEPGSTVSTLASYESDVMHHIVDRLKKFMSASNRYCRVVIRGPPLPPPPHTPSRSALAL